MMIPCNFTLIFCAYLIYNFSSGDESRAETRSSTNSMISDSYSNYSFASSMFPDQVSLYSGALTPEPIPDIGSRASMYLDSFRFIDLIK